MTAGTDKEEAEQFVLAAPKVQSYLSLRHIYIFLHPTTSICSLPIKQFTG
jgi:hypothetical protein